MPSTAFTYTAALLSLLSVLPALAAASLTSGTTYQISPAEHPSMCVAPAEASEGAQVVIKDCDEADTTWLWTGSSFHNTAADLCVDLTDGARWSGNKLQVWGCYPWNTNQQYTVDETMVHWDDFCWDLTDGRSDAGTHLQIWSCYSYNDHQQWVFTEVQEVDDCDTVSATETATVISTATATASDVTASATATAVESASESASASATDAIVTDSASVTATDSLANATATDSLANATASATDATATNSTLGAGLWSGGKSASESDSTDDWWATETASATATASATTTDWWSWATETESASSSSDWTANNTASESVSATANATSDAWESATTTDSWASASTSTDSDAWESATTTDSWSSEPTSSASDAWNETATATASATESANETATVTSSSVPTASGTGVISSGYLQTSGSKIVDSDGNTVILRGTNIGGWLVLEDWMCGITDNSGSSDRFSLSTLEKRFGTDQARTLVEAWAENWLTTADFDELANIGFNVIRLPFSFRTLYDASGNWRDDAFTRMDWAVAQAKARGIYVIIDFHMWAGQEADYSAISENTDEGARQRAEAAELWKKVAEHYLGDSSVAAFDVINEPTGSYGDYLQQALYDAVRSVDANRIIIHESISTNPANYGWTNVVYSLHEYLMMGDDFSSNKAQWQTSVQAYIDTWTGYGIPTMLAEFMADGDTLNYMLNQANEQGISWLNWAHSTVNMGRWGLWNHQAFNVDVSADSYDTILSTWSNMPGTFRTSVYDQYKTAATGSTSVSKRDAIPAPRAQKARRLTPSHGGRSRRNGMSHAVNGISF